MGVLQQALDENIITNYEFDSLNPENKDVGRFIVTSPRKAHSKPIVYNE